MKISKHFYRYEFQCKGMAKGICSCGMSTADFELIQVLEDIREHFKSPVTIYSGCRCDKYNKHVGGATRSKHKLGIASDIHVHGHTPKEVYDYLDKKYPNQYGLGLYKTFTHIDVRSFRSRWRG